MKIIFAVLLISTLSIAFAQESNTIIEDEKTSTPMLIGYCTKVVFEDGAFSEWWNEEYSAYEVDEIAADELLPFLENVKITIVAGSWCEDSRMQLPRFYKILDYLGFSDDNITLVFVNRKKVGLAEEVTGLDIQFVPTFIFYETELEIGRIIESPYETLESDMLSFFN